MKIGIPAFAIYLALTIIASDASAQEPGVEAGHRGGTQNGVKQQSSEESGVHEQTSARQSHGNMARLAFSSTEIVKQFQDNRSAFHNNYRGKVLQVSGSVWTFYRRQEDPPGIDIVLSGMVRTNRDDDQDSDNVCCETTDPKAILSAADLELGKNIVIRGLYDPGLRSNGLESRIILHDCRLR